MIKVPENHILVIFGASGDLTKRKLIPALYELHRQNLLPENYAILGVGRTQLDDSTFRQKMTGSICEEKKVDEDKLLQNFCDKLFYISIETSKKEEYKKLKTKLQELHKDPDKNPNYIFYLATPPSLYESIAQSLHFFGLSSEENGSWKRLIVEKPFGYDLASARELNINLLSYFSENQLYRIDHYLGKETVQNVMVTRFSNGIFEPLWNRNYIHHVEITSAESIGVESRGGYYDGSGALRDMVQNHLLHLVALVAMEPATEINSTAIRNETLKVFQSLRSYNSNNLEDYVIRGQYVASNVRGEHLKAYRDEPGVNQNSRTETYLALKLYIDNWRWGGVPFYIRTGKRLPTRVTEIVIHFKPTPHKLFNLNEENFNTDNQLIIRIQPDEGILLKFGMKVPGAGYHVQDVSMDFHYSDLSDVHVPEAYQRLLLDCMLGDSTLYARGDAVEEAWKFVDPILKLWKENPEIQVYGYPAGTWGPKIADDLIEGDNLTWRYPCKNLTSDGNYCEL
ncbi:MAG: glucose-6-phosphate dehydrogenase [Bacteroidales bacterium]|nr:glucose-6-phosphate dehydrogenase [Bacteroidales bacterium]